MGYFAEVNTLLRLPAGHGIELSKVRPGNEFEILKERERIFPLDCAILLEDEKGEFWGYCTATSATIENKNTKVRFKILSVFSKAERLIYSKRFDEAGRITGEIK